MPRPRKGETRKQYLKRAIPEFRKEGYTEKQAVGRAEGFYDTYHKKGTKRKRRR